MWSMGMRLFSHLFMNVELARKCLLLYVHFYVLVCVYVCVCVCVCVGDSWCDSQ